MSRLQAAIQISQRSQDGDKSKVRLAFETLILLKACRPKRLDRLLKALPMLSAHWLEHYLSRRKIYLPALDLRHGWRFGDRQFSPCQDLGH